MINKIVIIKQSYDLMYWIKKKENYVGIDSYDKVIKKVKQRNVFFRNFFTSYI